jgi:acyl-CoA synthetase (AMP-forming)/AMP-acid ligase II
MLYECWRDIAASRRTEMALTEVATGRRWTFGELALAAERTAPPAGRIVTPQGASSQFILQVLAGWRTKAVLCPVESGESLPAVPVPPPPVVHLKSTSATTGDPRWVAFTAEQLRADADNIVATMGLRPDHPNLGVVSLAHSYGFSNLVLPLLLHGVPLILAASALPESLRRAASGQAALTLPAVPALWRAWHEAAAIPANVKLALSAGAPLALSLEEEIFASNGLKVHTFYGSTECGGIAYDGTLQPRGDGACVGTPVRKVSVSLAEDGCLCVRSLAVGEGYWPAALPALSHGCFRTSDLCDLRDGQVYLVGRLGDLMNIAGRKVNPRTIEDTLAQNPAVRECLVFGVPGRGPGRGECIVACVARASSTDEADLRRFLLERLPPWQVPRAWWFVDSLGVNERGKVSRGAWRQRFLNRGQAHGQALAQPLDEAS